MQHTCGQAPNDEGRTLPQCNGYLLTAHGDGMISSTRHTADEIFDRLTQAVKNEYNPMETTRKDEAIALRENGRRMLRVIETVRTRTKAVNARALTDHMAETATTEPPPKGDVT